MAQEFTDGKEGNKPGIYVQKESGAQVITSDGDEGVIQADALVRVGYEWTNPVPSRLEILEAQKAQQIKEAKESKAEKAEIEASINKK